MARRSDTKLRAIPPVARTPHRTAGVIPVTLGPPAAASIKEKSGYFEDQREIGLGGGPRGDYAGVGRRRPGVPGLGEITGRTEVRRHRAAAAPRTRGVPDPARGLHGVRGRDARLPRR